MEDWSSEMLGHLVKITEQQACARAQLGAQIWLTTKFLPIIVLPFYMTKGLWTPLKNMLSSILCNIFIPEALELFIDYLPLIVSSHREVMWAASEMQLLVRREA